MAEFTLEALKSASASSIISNLKELKDGDGNFTVTISDPNQLFSHDPPKSQKSQQNNVRYKQCFRDEWMQVRYI